jgi:hypothetical protein
LEIVLNHKVLGFVLGIALLTEPGFAQIDLTGDWAPRIHTDEQDRRGGPDIGDYSGLPVNDSARMLADTWNSSRLSLQEHQCMAHMVAYMSQAPFPFRISMERNPDTQELIAIKIYYQVYEQTQMIWMDGRQHPSPNAKHMNMGFSTGQWTGDILTVTTTHLHQGWLRRNGIAQSSRATLREHWIRHGDVLTHVSILTDPVYLTEPYIRTDNFVMEPRAQGRWLYPCEASKEEIAGRPREEVPHYLPGENPYLTEFLPKRGMPAEASRGGAETMYPEYQLKLKNMKPPATTR